MAQKPLRLCTRCNQVHRGACEVRKADRQQYEARPERKEDKSFYGSVAWLRFRNAILNERPLCERCQETGHMRAAEHVHHVRARKDAPHLALDASNVQCLCKPCHSSIEATLRWGRKD